MNEPSVEEVERRVKELYWYAVGIARSKHKKSWTGVIDIEDAESAALIGLFKAATTYSSDRNARFKTYANLKIRGEIADLYRSKICNYSKALKKVTMNTIQIDMLPEDNTPDGDEKTPDFITIEDYTVRHAEDAEHARYCISKLPERLQTVLELIMYGHTHRQIGKYFNVTESRASQLIQEARRRAQEEWFK
jgi:RNA polymerase sigma factor (sigma-70 family)